MKPFGELRIGKRRDRRRAVVLFPDGVAQALRRHLFEVGQFCPQIESPDKRDAHRPTKLTAARHLFELTRYVFSNTRPPLFEDPRAAGADFRRDTSNAHLDKRDSPIVLEEAP